MNVYMIVVYLLLSIGMHQTTQEMRESRRSYLQNRTIPNAHLVENDPRFPAQYREEAR